MNNTFMNNTFDYKNFYSLLEINDPIKKEHALKELIDNYLSQHFFAEDRRWFNTLISYGLVNIVHYCEKTISDFCLYDKNHPSNHFSNVGFLWAIRSGDLDMVQYFMNHKDFPQFCHYDQLEKSIAQFVELYFDDCKRHNSIDIGNYEQLIDILVEKFPDSMGYIFDKSILNQREDEITPFLISFVKKYHPHLKDFLHNTDVENNFTRLCMISLNYHSFQFVEFLKQIYPDISMDDEFVSFYFVYQHNPRVLKWLIDNPNFLTLNKNHFNDIYEKIFNSKLKNKVKKSDYEFFFMTTKAGFHKVSIYEIKAAISSNLTPFVKKYYKEFKDYVFDLSLYPENDCVLFIHKQQKEKQYRELLQIFPPKNTNIKKIKI